MPGRVPAAANEALARDALTLSKIERTYHHYSSLGGAVGESLGEPTRDLQYLAGGIQSCVTARSGGYVNREQSWVDGNARALFTATKA